MDTDNFSRSPRSAADTGGGGGRPRSFDDKPSVADLIAAYTESGHNRCRCRYAVVSPALAARVKDEAGIDIVGFAHVIDVDGMRHMLARHGPTGAADRSIVAGDFDLIPAVVSAPDSIVVIPPSNLTLGLARIVYRKSVGRDVVVVEEAQTGRRRIRAITLRKET